MKASIKRIAGFKKITKFIFINKNEKELDFFFYLPYTATGTVISHVNRTAESLLYGLLRMLLRRKLQDNLRVE